MSVPIPIKTEEIILENAEYNSAEELDEELQLQLEDSGGESYHIHYTTEPSSPTHHKSSNMNSSGSKNGTPNGSGKNVLESEKRLRREIANSNERRRMQSINAGFQNLRSLLPRHEGEKLSKAAILQQTSQYIYELESQKTQLLAQNSQLKRQLGQQESGDAANNENVSNVALKKRKLTDNVINIQAISDSSDEGLGSMSPEPTTLLTTGGGGGGGSVINHAKSQVIIAHNTKELLEIKKQLDKERRLRNLLEDELSAIKRQLYSVATAPTQISTVQYIPREVIEHTDNLVHETVDELPMSYVEIDEETGQQVVVCSSIEELESDAATADIITEDNVHEEVILSSTSSTESEHEININAIAKAYAEGASTAAFQPILHATMKGKAKVEVERISDASLRVKTEKIEQPNSLTRSRQNLETIVEAIRHLEGDHLFSDGSGEAKQKSQESPLALTNKQQAHARTTLAELRPFLHLKGNKQVTILGNSGQALTLTQQQLASAAVKTNQQKDGSGGSGGGNGNTKVTPTAIYKVQTTSTNPTTSSGSGGATQQITITTTALKQSRPGVIVAQKLS